MENLIQKTGKHSYRSNNCEFRVFKGKLFPGTKEEDRNERSRFMILLISFSLNVRRLFNKLY